MTKFLPAQGRSTPSDYARRAWLILLCVAAMSAPPLAAQRSRVEIGGDMVGYLIPAGAFAATWVRRDDSGQLQFYRSFALNLGATIALKLVISKDRPDGSDQNAFPSGHTSVAFQGASFIHLRYGLRYAIPVYAGAAFVGYSREYAGKHYWVDVFSGAALGTLSSLLFTDRFRSLQISAAQVGRGYGVEVRMPW